MNKLKYRIQEEETLSIIRTVVCDVYQVTVDDIKGKMRGDMATPRHICLALGFSFTKNSQSSVGAYFGGKNHATVNYATGTLVNLYDTDKKYKEAIEKIIKMVSLMTAISFSINDVRAAAQRKKSKVVRRPCLIDMLNLRMITLLKGKNVDFFEEVIAMRKLYSVLSSEAA